MAPAQVPSSAVTISTVSAAVVRTRRRDLGSDRAQEQLTGGRHAAPDDDAVGRRAATIMLLMPMPR